MKMVKSLLLGTAAGLVAVAGAQAADMPVKAKPVQYVKICSLYGDGFYYIPGTDTCLKMGGYLRVQAEYNMGAGGIAVGQGTTEAPQGRFTRDFTNDVNYRSRAAISWDVRQQTEYGTLRTYIRTGIQVTTPTDSEAGAVFWDRAFMQFAGFTVGKTQSFFDLFTYGGGMSYHNVRVSGDTGAAGVTVWGYTAQFGNGVSGTVSLEAPQGHNKAGVVDLAVFGGVGATSGATGATSDTRATAGPFFNGGTTFDNAFGNNAGTGFRMPDVIANLRIDQAWGFVGVSGAIHDASGAYYTGNACTGPFGANTAFAPGNCVNFGHPADKLGWAVAAGGQLNLPGGDQIGINAAYTEGAVGYAMNSSPWSLYNASTSVGLGWAVDGVFDNGSSVELTRAWSIMAGYQHIWNPKWRTSLFGGYVKVDYNTNATTLINNRIVGCGGVAPAGAAASTAVPPPGAGINAGTATITTFAAGLGNSCNPDFSYFEVGTRTQWNPVAQLDIGLEVLYTHLNTAYKGAAAVAPVGSKPTVFAIDDQNVWSAMFRWQRNFYP